MKINLYKNIANLLGLVLLTFFLNLLSPQSAFADTYTLSGNVSDSAGGDINDAAISVIDANTSAIVGSTTTDTFGNYSLVITDGVYNVQITPPFGSNFSSAIALNQNVSSNKIINFILTPSGIVTLSGRIYDPLGNPVPSQRVNFGDASTSTDAFGNYSVQVSSGTYGLTILHQSGGNAASLRLPQFMNVTKTNYSLTQSTILDITLPLKKVDLHVQDASGNPINGVKITTDSSVFHQNSQGLSIGGDITNASGNGEYGSQGSTNAITDESGNVTLWLFANNNGSTYTFVATPPNGSGFNEYALTNIVINGDTSQTIMLPQSVTLSGHVYDALGNPLPNQRVNLNPGGSATTNSSGSYSIQVSPGTYGITVLSAVGGNTSSLNTPQFMNIAKTNYSITQNTTLDITLPLKKVSLHVKDSLGNPLNAVKITTDSSVFYQSSQGLSIGGGIVDASGNGEYGTNGATNAITNAAGNVDLWLFANNNGSTYTFTATPPSGSGFQDITLSNISISGDTQQTITLPKPVTLSGHIYDPLGNPLPNQRINLGEASTTTDVSGSYSMQVSSGTYGLTILHQSGGNTSSLKAPQFMNVSKTNYSVAQDSTLDVTLPLKKVDLHIQDSTGSPISGVKITTDSSVFHQNSQGLSIGGDITNASGNSEYGSLGATNAQTDESGNVTLWLFVNNNESFYTFNATPPSGSIFLPFTLNNVVVTGNQTEIISLQYNHATPTTTATISTEYEDETYSNPATVTLTASAAAGYSIADTYYTVDGGSQQTYTTPFTVSGNGNHIVTYWSVDSSGVQESDQTKSFTIAARHDLTGTVYVDTNQNGFQDSGENGYNGATITLDTEQTATTDSNGNYTFSDLVYGTYETTLTLPSGYTVTTTNPVSVALNANTTQNFGIFSGPSRVLGINAGGSATGNFDADTAYSGGSPYATTATVNTTGVTDPAPQGVYQTVRYGNFSYTLADLTPNAAYSFRLHFNELYWNSVGARVFDVKYNGQTVLDNYDILDAAGGKNKAIVVPVTGTANSSGVITLQFVTEFDNAMVNGIELYSGTLETPSPTPTPTVTVPYGVNTGGSTVGSYIADTGFSGGSLYTTTSNVDTSGVTNAAPEAVYKSVRYGNFTYTLPNQTPNTNYILRMHFNELYWNSVGSRVFDVSVNGTQVLNDYDILDEAGGKNKAVVEEIPVTANSSGNLVVQFSTVVDNAMVNGLEVVAAE